MNINIYDSPRIFNLVRVFLEKSSIIISNFKMYRLNIPEIKASCSFVEQIAEKEIQEEVCPIKFI